jgi:hypothetical protein
MGYFVGEHREGDCVYKGSNIGEEVLGMDFVRTGDSLGEGETKLTPHHKDPVDKSEFLDRSIESGPLSPGRSGHQTVELNPT